LYFNQPPAADLFVARESDQARAVDVTQRVIPFPRLWTHLRLGCEVALHPPDVLFVPAHVLPLWTRPPAVVTVHDLGYRHFPQAHPRRQRWYLDCSTRHNARVARVVIADSHATARDLVASYGVDPLKIVVVYPGPDPALAPVDDPQRLAAVKRRYGIRGDYLVHIGTLQPRKNLSRLVQAFAALLSDSSAWPLQLVLAGKKGWLHADLFRQVRHLSLEERVLFPGYVDDADKGALLSGALAYVLPSLYEGFGFPALEAQICETPLICAETTSLPEVAGDGALWVDPLDVDGWTRAMSRVARDAALRAALVARGRVNRKRFSWCATARAALAALETAAQGS
jgi:glycosyltransferase involved in cell wall biosynthesis